MLYWTEGTNLWNVYLKYWANNTKAIKAQEHNQELTEQLDTNSNAFIYLFISQENDNLD